MDCSKQVADLVLTRCRRPNKRDPRPGSLCFEQLVHKASQFFGFDAHVTLARSIHVTVADTESISRCDILAALDALE